MSTVRLPSSMHCQYSARTSTRPRKSTSVLPSKSLRPFSRSPEGTLREGVREDVSGGRVGAQLPRQRCARDGGLLGLASAQYGPAGEGKVRGAGNQPRLQVQLLNL